RTQRSRQSVKRSARRGGTDPGRYCLPAASRSESTRVGMDCVKAGNRHWATVRQNHSLSLLVPIACCLLPSSIFQPHLRPKIHAVFVGLEAGGTDGVGGAVLRA